MSGWTCKVLGNGLVALEPTRTIMDAFMLSFIAAGAPIDMAVFSAGVVSEEGRHVVTIYFSEGAEKFGSTFGAVPCDKPPLDDLGLLCGDKRAWKLFFPERD